MFNLMGRQNTTYVSNLNKTDWKMCPIDKNKTSLDWPVGAAQDGKAEFVCGGKTLQNANKCVGFLGQVQLSILLCLFYTVC